MKLFKNLKSRKEVIIGAKINACTEVYIRFQEKVKEPIGHNDTYANCVNALKKAIIEYLRDVEEGKEKIK